MSSVTSVGVGQGLYQFFQGISSTAEAQSTGQTAATTPTTSPTAGATVQTVNGHHHHHGQGGSFKQIEDAVTSALQSAQSGGSSSEPNKVIEDAIAKVFSQNGSALSTQPTNGQATASDSDGDHDASGKADNAANSATQTFLQTLQKFGVDPQQFHQDLLAAIKDAQNGQANPSSVFQNFPPGSTVDTLA